jgi:ribosomal protein S18 acetylase RimI-like enzyme
MFREVLSFEREHSHFPHNLPDKVGLQMTFRFIRENDPHVTTVKRHLLQTYQEHPSTTDTFLRDPKTHIFGMFLNNGLIAFAVLEDLEQFYQNSNYAEMFMTYREFISKHKINGFYIRRIWGMSELPSYENNLSLLLQAFHTSVSSDKELFALSYHTTDAHHWAQWHRMQTKMGFETLPVVYTKLRCELRSFMRHAPSKKQEVFQTGPHQIAPFHSGHFSFPSLVSCYNNTFFGGEERITKQALENSLSRSSFSPSLSLVAVSKQTQEVSAFVLVDRWDESADIALLGVAPEYRRQGLVRNSIQFLFHLLVTANIKQLYWEINTSNTPIRRLIETYLPVAEVERKQTHFLIKRGKEVLSFQALMS